MRVVVPCCLVVLALALVPALPARAGRADWAGTAACGTCHPRELAAWQATPHATTGARLPARPAARCVVCHATGESPAGVTVERGVGCEACHGAGAAFAEADLMLDDELARAIGLVDLSTPAARAAVCGRCHVAGLRLDAAALEAAVATIHPTSSTTELP